MAILALLPLPAGAASNGGWSVFPTNSASQQPRSLFVVALQPNVPYSDSVTVANLTPNTLTFNLYAAAAYNTVNGGYAAKPRLAPKTGVAAWMHLPVDHVTVEGQRQVTVPFVILPPQNIAPGDYFGSIVAESTTGVTQSHGGVKVTVLQAVGSRVYSRVAGPLHPSLQVAAMHITTSGGVGTLFGGPVHGVVQVTLTNTGNQALAPRFTGSISPLIGSSLQLKPLQMDLVLPGNTVTATLPYGSIVPVGRLTANVKVTAGSVALTPSTSTFVIPWLLLLVIAIVIVAVVVLVRRRRSQAGPPEGGPEGSG